MGMYRVRRSDVFKKWHLKLKDRVAKALIDARINRLEQGNPGDCRPVGDGVSEMRIFYGPGYRVYFMESGMDVVVLLCGGDKATQKQDITNAKAIAVQYKEQEK
jgi:putative addiction module killer protein